LGVFWGGNPKSEIRRPKEIRNPKAEKRQDVTERAVRFPAGPVLGRVNAWNGLALESATGYFGFQISGFGPRVSDFSHPRLAHWKERSYCSYLSSLRASFFVASLVDLSSAI
jgi:hypothetical protein